MQTHKVRAGEQRQGGKWDRVMDGENRDQEEEKKTEKKGRNEAVMR